MPNGDEVRAEFERLMREREANKRKRDYADARPVVGKGLVEDSFRSEAKSQGFAVKDKEDKPAEENPDRFTEEQKAWARGMAVRFSDDVDYPKPPVQPTGRREDGPKVGHKDTNPKDAVGTKKWRQYCTVPMTIIWELGVAMLEGARKYGRHNYRVAGVRASVYIDAAKGHIDQWWEGEDIDAESNLNHLVKAMASLAVLRDAMHQKLRADLQEAVNSIFERIPEAEDAYLEGDQYGDQE
jgi:hypothetical protein